jgi:hypothetical protein
MAPVLRRPELFFYGACRMGLEGLVSKRRDRPYQPSRPKQVRSDLANARTDSRMCFSACLVPFLRLYMQLVQRRYSPGTLRPRTGPEPRRRPLPAPSIRCRRSGPLLL